MVGAPPGGAGAEGRGSSGRALASGEVKTQTFFLGFFFSQKFFFFFRVFNSSFLRSPILEPTSRTSPWRPPPSRKTLSWWLSTVKRLTVGLVGMTVSLVLFVGMN